MATLSHKTTILLSPEEHQLLLQEARKARATMGDMIRRAIRKVYRPVNQSKNKSDWDHLFKSNAPVGSLEDMEKEILKGRLES